MTNGNGGHVPTKIVELLISNITELTKQVQRMPGEISEEIAHELERITTATTTVINKLTTPPRNEELDKKLDDTISKVDTGHEDLKQAVEDIDNTVKTELVNKISWMTRSVWLAFTLFAVVIFISSLFITFNKPKIDITAQPATYEVILKKLQRIEDENLTFKKALEIHKRALELHNLEKNENVEDGER